MQDRWRISAAASLVVFIPTSALPGNLNIYNDMNISLDLQSANLILTALMDVAEAQFLSFPLRDVLNLDCWLATIPAPALNQEGVRVEGVQRTAGLAYLAASIAHLHLNISCVDCSSPGMSDLTRLLASVQAQDDATHVANRILDYISQLMGGPYLQVKIDRMLNDAAKKCPHSPTYDPGYISTDYQPLTSPDTKPSITFLIAVAVSILCLIIAVATLVTVIKFIVRRRHRKWLQTLPTPQTRRLLRRQEKEQQMEAQLNAATQSLFRSPEIPALLRWSMPVIILGNIGFFLSGHLSLGATVNIAGELAGQTFLVDKFFEFSMFKSTIEIWNAGGRSLAILMIIFSGIWPYTKQLITLALWFLPPSRVSISRRGSILVWLDWLAKWSMVDVFVLVLSLAAFR